MTAIDDAVDVILKDGSTLRLRPPTSDDADALARFLEGLSLRSRFLRFHGLPATPTWPLVAAAATACSTHLARPAC